MSVKCTFCNDTKQEPGIPGPCVWCEEVEPVTLGTVTRYAESCGEGGGVVEHASGKFVEFKDYDAALAREAALLEELDAIKRVGPPHFCGLPMSLNPHAEAGKPGRLLEVGAHRECIPCLVSSRHGWAKTAGEQQQRLTVAEQRAGELEALLLESNELLYVIQDGLGGNLWSAVDVLRGKVFTALKPAAEGGCS
ncbi:MAG: hypothetical protein V4749_17855 [Pseudomonadota bacterium]